MAENKRVIKKPADNEPDLFEEVFGIDEEVKEARKKLNEIAKKEAERMEKSIYGEADAEESKATEPEEVEGKKEESIAEQKQEETGGEKKRKKKRGKGKGRTRKRKGAVEEPSEKEPEEVEAEEPEDTEPVKEPEEKERKSTEKEKEEAESKAEKKKALEKRVEEKIVVTEPKFEVQPKLSFLEDEEGNVFIGRKKSVYEKYGSQAALFIGRVWEEGYKKKNVFLDSLNPHVVFVCGARGSGKSYVLGVIAEELALKNKGVGIIVVDPVGVFWSMRYPNREEKELQALEKWGLEPKGLENIVVFVPKGMEKHTPKGTYDATFSIKPSMLTAQDWCLTFGIDRFSPTGLLLEKALEKVEKGYITVDKERIKGTKDYSIDDIIFCLENDAELNSRDRGYKVDSIRALVSRFEAAKSWGVFDTRGTPLSELSRENQLTIIDTSFLDDNVTALVIGILARRLLAARKIATRREAAKRFESTEDMLELEIPPTWLIIDEAHTLIPSGNIKTAASDALIEYVKQGRRPGCSLVFATQQPSAIDTRVLSQLDIIIVHKLVFNDDIKAVYKRTPAIIPHKYKAGAFIRTLPVGVALVGDRREETSRAFIMRIRPRMSQHEGRETETIETKVVLSNEQVLKLISSMYWARLKRDGKAKIIEINRTLNSLNAKYSSTVELDDVLAELENKGAEIDEASGFVLLEEKKPAHAEEPEAEEETEPVEEPEEKEEEPEAEKGEAEVELLSFPVRYTREKAEAKMRRKLGKLFGLLAGNERLIEVNLKYIPIYRIEFNYFNAQNMFRQGVMFVNSLTGEFIHFKDKFIESKGLKDLYGLKEAEITVLNFLTKPLTALEISRKVFMDENKVKRILKELVEKELVKIVEKNGTILYCLNRRFDLPRSPLHPLHFSLQRLPLVTAEALMKEKEKYSKKEVRELLQKIWKKLVVTSIKEIYWPAYEGIVENIKTGKQKRLYIDAFSGQEISLS
ncbi:MAG: DUF87 domain-containing protein [Candidatus Diapherotrites archaeon]|nr:DUF87 domain-containing protein [Candidatus Diapherotrites archaeon]